MSSYKSGQPVRSKADGSDERLHMKIVDGTTSPAVNQVEVDSDDNLHIEQHGNKPDNSDVVRILTEEGRGTNRGDYDVSDNTKPSSEAIVAHERSSTHDETKQVMRPTAVAGEGDSHCLDVSLHDSSGNNFDDNNPLPVTMNEGSGDEIADYDKAVDTAKDASTTHTYSVANGKTFLLNKILCRCSGRGEYLLEIGDGDSPEVFAEKAWGINSASNGNAADIDLGKSGIKVVGTTNTTTVKLTKLNTDNQVQDMYSTILGYLKNTTI